jgi:competence CoiA-like predicted nuclease
MIHTQSSKINHYLGLADIYIRIGCPEFYHIEHHIENGAYIPDAVTKIGEHTVVIELQRSVISESKMQDKVDNFVKYYSCHGSRHLWIFTDKEYKLRVPPGFHIEQKKMTPTLC